MSLYELVNFQLCPNRFIPVMGMNTPAVSSQAVICF